MMPHVANIAEVTRRRMAHMKRHMASNRGKLVWMVITGVLLATLVTSANPVITPPPFPDFGHAIDPYADYGGQDTCDPTFKPGVVEFADLLESIYGRSNLGMVRDCGVGAQSEHKEGRALDYPFNAFDSAQFVQARDLLNWLFATDRYGNPHALARRLGIMYIVWNRRIWRSYRPSLGWLPYSGTNPHTDHIHFSFSWAGAQRQTTWWTDISYGHS
jgi:hypothetical protein